jgi:hypothetical protein
MDVLPLVPAAVAAGAQTENATPMTSGATKVMNDSLFKGSLLKTLKGGLFADG